MYNVDGVDKAEELNFLLASLNPTTVFGGFAIKLITCEKPQKKWHGKKCIEPCISLNYLQ